MKKQFLSLVYAIILLPLFLCACNDDDTGVYTELDIVKVLPRIYLLELENDPHVINTMADFDKIFNSEDVDQYPDLKLFNPEIHTLLFSCDIYPFQVSNIKHKFTQSDSGKYVYLIDVAGMQPTPEMFCYGIIVDKLPAKANVDFRVEHVYNDR